MTEDTSSGNTGAAWCHGVGIAASAFIVILISVYIWLNWTGVLALKPNEFGDFLAGALGPLAILWLILGFFSTKYGA